MYFYPQIAKTDTGNAQYNFSTCLPDPKKRHPAGVSSANSKGGMATRRAELLSKDRRMPDLSNVESRIKSDIAAATAKATRGERTAKQQQQKVGEIIVATRNRYSKEIN